MNGFKRLITGLGVQRRVLSETEPRRRRLPLDIWGPGSLGRQEQQEWRVL